jgi:bifunctional polynucleotide phosphatase/kinase
VFRWIQPALGAKRSCLYGINLNPKNNAKVAAFDLDGTLVKSDRTTRNDITWEWWRKVVPDKLKEVHEAGYLCPFHLRNSCPLTFQRYSVVVISNQALKPGNLEPWKKKMTSISAAVGISAHLSSHHLTPDHIIFQLPEVPFRIFAATAKDEYRKPIPGMWLELERIFRSDNVCIGEEEGFSFFSSIIL